MNDLIKREDAIKAVVNTPSNIADVMGNNLCLDGAVFRQNEIIDILKDIPSAEPKPVLTEEVREAIMRLTMCARHECAICKLSNNEDDCYEIATKRMHILADAFDKPKHGEWIGKGDYEAISVKCSICGRDNGLSASDFCPNCGARMNK